MKDTDLDDPETNTAIASGYDMISLVPVSKFVHYVRGKQATNSDWFKEEFNVSNMITDFLIYYSS